MSEFAVRRRAGGWGWLALPVILMFVGSNVVFGGMVAVLGDMGAASRQTQAVGPVTWSVLQLVLLWLAVRGLRRSRRSVKEVVGYERGRLARDLGSGLGIAVLGSVVVLASLRIVEPLLGLQPSPFPTWALVWWTVVTSVTAGVGEELYFRGFLFERLRRLSVPRLLLLTSLSFAVWHIAPVMLLP